MHKRLVAGLSGLVKCLQSNSIGTNFCGLLFKLRRSGLFHFPSCSLCSLLGACWLAGSRRPDGGGESHHFRGNQNPGPGRLPAPAAPQLTNTLSLVSRNKNVLLQFYCRLSMWLKENPHFILVPFPSFLRIKVFSHAPSSWGWQKFTDFWPETNRKKKILIPLRFFQLRFRSVQESTTEWRQNLLVDIL